MTRITLLALVAVLAFAQTGRDAYRDAYRAWREADPSLERDAARGNPALAANVDRVAQEAAKYGAERGAFLTQAAAQKEQQLAWLGQTRAQLVDFPDGATEQIAVSAIAVRRTIDTYSSDPDPGIQQVRAMLERENTALTALSTSIAARRKAGTSAQSAALTAEKARLAAFAVSAEMVAGLGQSSEAFTRETAAWADYYRTLSDETRGTVAAPPVSATPSSPAPIPMAPLGRSVTPIPLPRYTGAWTYPTADGLFHGPQPLVVDLVVSEENGHAEGTLAGRFKVPSGDPVVSFSFSGQFQSTRNQSFALETADGSRGTLELIPGPAFNLLEINFTIDAKPGKIRQANFLLVKK